RLDALDQDTRLLIDLIERSRQSAEHDAALEYGVAEAGLHAITVVVPHYRISSLNRPDGQVEILAVDPTETGAMVDALTPHMKRLAREVSTTRVRAIGETARYGAR